MMRDDRHRPRIMWRLGTRYRRHWTDLRPILNPDFFHVRRVLDLRRIREIKQVIVVNISPIIV